MSEPSTLLAAFEADGDYAVWDLQSDAVEFHFRSSIGLQVPSARLHPADIAAIAHAVAAVRSEPQHILVSMSEAARLLGITKNALKQRVHRHQVPGVVRTGRRVQFRLDLLRAHKTAREP